MKEDRREKEKEKCGLRTRSEMVALRGKVEREDGDGKKGIK